MCQLATPPIAAASAVNKAPDAAQVPLTTNDASTNRLVPQYDEYAGTSSSVASGVRLCKTLHMRTETASVIASPVKILADAY